MAVKSISDQLEAIRTLRIDLDLPRFILVAEGDNELPVDLENILSISSFGDLIKDRSDVSIFEMFPAPNDLCAYSSDGTFTHEIVLPFTKSPDASSITPSRDQDIARLAHTCDVRAYAPGSEWLYLKLYGGLSVSDKLLTEIVRTLARDCLQAKHIDKWFFLRYADPNWHLRIRLHGNPSILCTHVLPKISKVLSGPLDDGRLWRIQLDTYHPEIDRYGGHKAMDISESIFQVDSDAAIKIIKATSSDDVVEFRWKFALRGIDDMLAVFGYSNAEKQELMAALRDNMATSLGIGKINRSANVKFQKERESLSGILSSAECGVKTLTPAFSALRKRQARLESLARKLRVLESNGGLTSPLIDIVSSYLHMFINRLLMSDHLAQEYLIYDFLARIYRSRVARGRIDETKMA